MAKALYLPLLVVALAGISLGQNTLSVSASTPATIPLVSDPTPQSSFNIVTSWNQVNTTHASVCIYMSGPMTGSNGNGDTIPASSVRANGSSIVTGATNCGIAGASIVVNSVQIKGRSSRTDTVTLNIGSYSSNLSPDTYTGTINIVATTQ